MHGFAQDVTPKKYQSLLWEITGNGLKKPSYLYGTMHISKKVAFHLNDTFFIALKSCDMIANEFNLESWMDLRMDLTKARNSMEYLKYYYSSSRFYDEAFNLYSPTSKDLKDMLKFYPYFVDQMLYRTYEQNADYEEDTYLDMFIFQAGKKLNKMIGGLEDFLKSEESVNKAQAYMYNDNLTDEEKERNRLRLQEIEKKYSSRWDIMDDAYRNGDLDVIDTIEKLTYAKRYMTYMLYNRNVMMANSIDSIIKNHTLFAGAGCAHLPGDSGVISLLRKKGYTLRPVNYASTSGMDSKTRTELEDTRFPVNFTVQYSPDSTFSVNVPGKMVEYSAQTYGSKSYIYNDLGNGSYYYINRLNHFGKLAGKTEDYILQRIDSLLYETIPGEISLKNKITSNLGYPGYEIENKTKTGDKQRYRIYISPDEIFMFKMSGNGEYVGKGTEANTFFESITFYQKKNNSFKEIVNNNCGFKVNFPETFVRYKAKDASDDRMELITSGSLKSDDYYFMTVAKLYDYDYIEEDTFELNMLAESFAETIGDTITHRSLLHVGAYPALDASMKNSGNIVNVRIVIRGANYYMLGCKNSDADKTKDFLNSFKLTDVAYIKPFRDYKDTALYFKVKTQFEENKFIDEIKKEEESPRYEYSYHDKVKKSEDFLPISKSRYFISNETGEIISVDFNKYSMFYQVKSMDEYWKKRTENWVKRNGMFINHKKSLDSGKISERSFVLTDTNSTRGIMVKMIQKCGVLYTLAATIDTVAGPSKFVTTFFNSFTPADTCIGVDLTSDKINEHLFGKIYSADTNERKKARSAIEYVIYNLTDVHAKALMKCIADTGFKRIDIKDRLSLIKALGGLKSKEIIPFLEKMYEDFNDSISVQLAVLEAVAAQKTDVAAKTFTKLLGKHLIVSSSDGDIEDIFQSFRDSLEVGAKLFPEILKYTRYQEYRIPIYELLAKLIEKGKVKPHVYEHARNEMIRDAQYNMTLLMSTNQDKSRSGNSYNYWGDYNYSNYSNNYNSDWGSYDYNSKEDNDPANKLKSSEKKIYNFAVILFRNYSNPTVKKEIVNKIITSGSDDLAISVIAYYLKKGVNINDTLWDHFSSKPATQISLYRSLSYIKRMDKFSVKNLKEEKLAASQLFADDFDLKKDSVVLVEKRYVQSKKDSGYIYIFKACAHDKTLWKLGYTGIHPKDTTKINVDPEVFANSKTFESEKQMMDEIKSMAKKVRVLGRNRVSSYSWGENYYGSYGKYGYGDN